MNTSADTQAFPGPMGALERGLTKREYFAAMAMQGILAGLPHMAEYSEAVTAHCAVAHADALLAELAKDSK